MKKCSYCGKECSDDATVCDIDGQALTPPAGRKKVTGVWRGVYGYGEHKESPVLNPVAFTLKLKQGWMEHFKGSVTEDGPQGAPGTGSVEGYFEHPVIEFTKQMPVGYIIGQDGVRRTLRESLLAQGYACEHELPGAPIFYQGTLLDPDRMQGTWIVNPHRISSPDGGHWRTGRTAGFWCAQFVTDNLAADPTGGPTEALFDKSLLSPRELEDVEGGAVLSLGKFNVPDAEKILDRFEQENIRFDVNRDDAPPRYMHPLLTAYGGHLAMAASIEIFVHPEDEAKAEAIISQDDVT